MRYTPMRCTPEVHAHGTHAGEMHAYEMHANEVHPHEMHAREMHAHEVHAREVHAHKIHAREVHAREMHAREMHAREVHAHETLTNGGAVSICRDLSCKKRDFALSCGVVPMVCCTRVLGKPESEVTPGRNCV